MLTGGFQGLLSKIEKGGGIKIKIKKNPKDFKEFIRSCHRRPSEARRAIADLSSCRS